MTFLVRSVFLFTLMIFSLTVQGQWISINEDGASPNSSAALDITATDKGVLIPRMSSAQRLAIPSPEQGLLVFQNDGEVGFYFYDGIIWDTLKGKTTINNISNVTNFLNSGIAVIRDVKAAGTDGGTFTSGAWQTRELNDIDGDLTFISLGTNQFTLDSGTYVVAASAPAFEVDDHQIRLFNVTAGVQAGVGTVIYSKSFASSPSTLTKVITVGSTPETFEIQHRCTISKATNGLGRGVPFGSNVFTTITIEKL